MGPHDGVPPGGEPLAAYRPGPATGRPRPRRTDADRRPERGARGPGGSAEAAAEAQRQALVLHHPPTCPCTTSPARSASPKEPSRPGSAAVGQHSPCCSPTRKDSAMPDPIDGSRRLHHAQRLALPPAGYVGVATASGVATTRWPPSGASRSSRRSSPRRRHRRPRVVGRRRPSRPRPRSTGGTRSRRRSTSPLSRRLAGPLPRVRRQRDRRLPPLRPDVVLRLGARHRHHRRYLWRAEHGELRARTVALFADDQTAAREVAALRESVQSCPDVRVAGTDYVWSTVDASVLADDSLVLSSQVQLDPTTLSGPHAVRGGPGRQRGLHRLHPHVRGGRAGHRRDAAVP